VYTIHGIQNFLKKCAANSILAISYHIIGIFNQINVPYFRFFTNFFIKTGNHDNTRIGTRIGVDFIDFANALNLLLGGTAVTYYGEEIGMVDIGREKISYEECQDEYGKKQGVN
jgi:hypothetical protein